jgi:hypothetical protein
MARTKHLRLPKASVRLDTETERNLCSFWKTFHSQDDQTSAAQILFFFLLKKLSLVIFVLLLFLFVHLFLKQEISFSADTASR